MKRSSKIVWYLKLTKMFPGNLLHIYCLIKHDNKIIFGTNLKRYKSLFHKQKYFLFLKTFSLPPFYFHFIDDRKINQSMFNLDNKCLLLNSCQFSVKLNHSRHQLQLKLDLITVAEIVTFCPKIVATLSSVFFHWNILEAQAAGRSWNLGYLCSILRTHFVNG